MIDELNYFYNNYKRPEGKETKVIAWGGIDDAKKLIDECRTRFQNSKFSLKTD
jgi:inorganic pyrophosphatase